MFLLTVIKIVDYEKMSGCCALPNIFRAKIRLKTSHLFTFPSDWQKLGKPYGSVAKKGKKLQ